MIRSVTGLALVECFRPHEYAGQLELQVGAPAIRRWPTRHCEGLEISLQIGPAHEEIVLGRRTETPGKMTFVQLPGTVWSAEQAVGGFFSIELAPELFARFVNDWPNHSVLPGPSQLAMPHLLDAFWFAHKVLRSPADATARTEALVTLIGMVLGTLTGPPAPMTSDGISRVRDAIHDSPGRAPTIEELASLSGLSTFEMVRTFRRRYGIGPSAYRRSLQVARARRMVLAGRTVEEISTDLGFASAVELRRSFVRRFGLQLDLYADGVAGSSPARVA
jgi:AraC-like DNA-binding protein